LLAIFNFCSSDVAFLSNVAKRLGFSITSVMTSVFILSGIELNKLLKALEPAPAATKAPGPCPPKTELCNFVPIAEPVILK